MNITESSLQRRGLIERAAAAEGKACIDDSNAGVCEPDCVLRDLREDRLVLQRSSKGAMPVTCDLDIEERSCGSQLGFGTAELLSEPFRISHRSRGTELLPTCPGMRDEFVQSAIGHTDPERAVQ